jgi:hypothetical protein
MNLLPDGLLTWSLIVVVILALAGGTAYFFPPFRRAALAVAAFCFGLFLVYLKGNRDRARQEREQREKAAKKVREKYDAIDKKPSTDDDVQNDLRKGRF